MRKSFMIVDAVLLLIFALSLLISGYLTVGINAMVQTGLLLVLSVNVLLVSAITAGDIKTEKIKAGPKTLIAFILVNLAVIYYIIMLLSGILI